jgi:hypothetical protein
MGDHAAMEDFLLRTAAIPLAVAAVAAGLLRFVAGPTQGPAMAGAAICLGFLAGYGLTVGTPAVWPPASAQKLFFIAAAGGILGLALDFSAESRRVSLPAAMTALVIALAWLGWSRLLISDWADIALLLLVAAAGAITLGSLHARSEEPAECAVKLVVASAALSALALQGASLSTAQLCGALAAAAGGFALWLWPRPRLRFAASALLGGGLAFVALAGSVAVFTNAAKPALILLLPIFFAERALGRYGAGGRRRGQALRPVLVAIVALVPAAAAIGLAGLLGGSGY